MQIPEGELKQILELLKSKIVDRNLPPIASLEDYRDFLAQELAFWGELSTPPNFTGLLSNLKNFADQMLSGPGSYVISHNPFEHSRGALLQFGSAIPLSTDRFGPQLKKIMGQANSGRIAKGFLDYLNGKIEDRNIESNYFDGLMLAAFTSRAELLGSEPLLGNLGLQTNQQRFNQMLENLRARTEALGQSAHEEFNSKKLECEGVLAAFQDLIRREQIAFGDRVVKFSDETEAAIKKSREQFDAQMSLQEPASYWDRLRKDYSWVGHGFLLLSGLAVLVGLLCVGWVLKTPLPVLSESIGAPGSVRGLLLIAFGSTLLLIFLQTSIRIALGSYHLSRDANERKQLTYVFMALVKSGTIQPAEKEVILAALFSRSDTGLLKSDGTPAVPNSLSALVDSLKK